MNKIIDKLDLHYKINTAVKIRRCYIIMLILTVISAVMNYFEKNKIDMVFVCVIVLTLTIIQWISANIKDNQEIIHELHKEMLNEYVE